MKLGSVRAASTTRLWVAVESESKAASCSRPVSGRRCGCVQDTRQPDVVSVPGYRGRSSHKVGPQAMTALIIAKAGQENSINNCTGCTNRVLLPQNINSGRKLLLLKKASYYVTVSRKQEQ